MTFTLSALSLVYLPNVEFFLIDYTWYTQLKNVPTLSLVSYRFGKNLGSLRILTSLYIGKKGIIVLIQNQ